MQSENTRRWRCALGCLAMCALIWPGAQRCLAADKHPLLAIMTSELELSMDKLVSDDGTKPYFIQYAVTDSDTVNVSASLGALSAKTQDHSRQLDVDVRCGDYELDSTRQIRGGGGYDRWGRAAPLPLNGDPIATRHAIWLSTDSEFKDAVKRLAQVKANLKVKVEEEDPSDDFSRETPSQEIDPWVEQPVDLEELSARVKRLSRRMREHPLIYGSSVSIQGSVENNLIVNSEGSTLQYGRGWWRISAYVSTVAEDGMNLYLHDAFDAASPEGLPDEAKVAEAIDALIAKLLALRAAPVVEPYTGPAILLNRASGVFFHEIFGHRIEGHRQKDVEEGQTFAKKLGQEVLPEFLSVVDDPSVAKFEGIDLNGYYRFDNECVPAQPAKLVENGVLETFLMSRSPTRGITHSNGHGRRQPGMKVVARQGNLIVESRREVPIAELRDKLIAECKKQSKSFGLLFEDISGGFTTTQRWGPQAFKVIPLVVYKVYVDGKPDELVRGVDLVGTPLTSFSKILCTGNDPDVFNGYCGAESGYVPVSAISPSILVEQIEVEKKQKAQEKPPILPPPIAQENEPKTANAGE